MTKKEIIIQLKAQLDTVKKEFRNSKIMYILTDALNLLEREFNDNEEVIKLTKKLEICEMNKEMWKRRFEELNKRLKT